MKPTEQERKGFWERYGCSADYVALDIDLNSLFRYAVPNLEDKYQNVRIVSFKDDLNNKLFWFAHIIDKGTDNIEYSSIVGCDSPGEALFWALDMARKEKK